MVPAENIQIFNVLRVALNGTQATNVTATGSKSTVNDQAVAVNRTTGQVGAPCPATKCMP